MESTFPLEAQTAFEAKLGDIREHKGWFIALGVLLIILGTAAIVFPFVAALAATLLIGWILLFAGIGQSTHAFRVHRWRGFMLALLGGILAMAVGISLLFFPLAGILSLTLLIGAYFLANGTIRIVLSLQLRPAPGWGWMLFGGIISILLSLLVLVQWPSAATWLIGLLVGVDLVFGGWALLWLALLAGRGNRQSA